MNLLGQLSKKERKLEDKIENPRLLKAIQDVALNDTPENRKTLYREFLDAILIFPTPEITGKPGAQVADAKTTFQITGITNKNGLPVTPAFTDDEALFNWDPNTPSVGMNARDFFEMLIPMSFQEVIINPFDPRRKMVRPGGRVTRHEFEALAKGEIPEPQPAVATVRPRAGTKLRFKKASVDLPEGAITQISKILVSFEEVQSAFLLNIAYGDERPHRAVAIESSRQVPETRQRMLATHILEIVRSSLQDNEAFDLLPMSTDLSRIVRQTISPFYTRPGT